MANQKYHVCRHINPAELQDLVTRYLDRGYVVHGSLMAVGGYFYQTVVHNG